MSFSPGETVYALNPKYRDGTRLRALPADDATFNGVWAPNDAELEVVEAANAFVRVKKRDGEQGWIRERNVTRTCRVPGVTRGVLTSEVVTPDPEYVRGIKIYNLGIKQDAVPGQKLGKGLQHLISPKWTSALSEFVGKNIAPIREIVKHARDGAREQPGYDYVYLTNTAEQLFERSLTMGLKGEDALDLFHMATYAIMVAAEVDDFPFAKYTKAERAQQRADLYTRVLTEGPTGSAVAPPSPAVLGKFDVPVARRDFLPPIAMERLAINNELSALKYADPAAPLRDGFPLSTRIDSLMRHFDAVHRRLTDEDHAIHLLWNFHAIFHVAVVFPEKNDLVSYAGTARKRAEAPRPYEPTGSLDKIARGGLTPDAVQKLDWNEGAIAPPPSVVAAIAAHVQAAGGAYLKWYPHLGGGTELRAAIAEYAGVIPENLLVTNGSDDALVLICQTLLREGTTVLAPVPTYEHFCVDALGAGAELIRLELADPFRADPGELSRAVDARAPTVVYLVSPSNPTGIEWSSASVDELAGRHPRTTFIVDEAYFEFGSTDEGAERPRSCVRLATERANVIVTRTFSKAFCLAAVRCGYLVAHPNTVETMRARYNPKSVNQLAQIAAVHALREMEPHYAPYIAETNAARESFVAQLRAAGVDVRSGGAGNFVCLRVGDTARLCRRLEERAIFVRDLGGRFPGYVRVTIGPRMDGVAAAILEALDPS